MNTDWLILIIHNATNFYWITILQNFHLVLVTVINFIFMSKRGYKKPTNQLESNENQYKDDNESEIPYRRSLIIQQFNEFKMLIQSQEEQIKETKNEIKSKNEQIENEIRMRSDLNSKVFDLERKINDLETINIFQKNEIDKKDKKIKLLNQEIFNLKSKKIPSNDFVDQEAKDMIDHLSKELDDKDLEIIKLNTKIQYLLNGKNIRETKTSNKDDLLYSDDSYSDNKEQQQPKSFKSQPIKQISKLNKISISSKSNQTQRTVPSSNISPGKSSTSNSQMTKTNKKIKKINNDKPAENFEINIDVVTEAKAVKHEPHYKNKSPPKLDIPSISTSQKLLLPTPTNNQNHEENDEYDEEEELPNTSRSATTQNKKGKKSVNENNKRKLERDFKSDDDLIKPKQTNSKRITKKKKTIRRQSVKRTVNHNQNENDDSNGDLSYSEPSQNKQIKKKIVKKTTKKVIKKGPSPAQNDSENEKNSQDNFENSKSQPISKLNSKNSQKRSKVIEPKEPIPNINFESEDDNYQSSDEQQPKQNAPPATKVKKVTRKVIRKRVINNDKKGELAKTTNINLNNKIINNDNENETNNKNIIKKRKVVKKKVLHKTSTNVINDNNNNSSSGTIDSNDVQPNQKILAVQSIKLNKENQNIDFNDNDMLPTPTPNPVKSRVKSKTRSKSKTVNISKPQQNLLNKTDQVPLKQQQSQPQVKPQNYGEGATIASRAAWLNNELFGQNNNDENLEELFERVVEINKAIVRNPRRGVNRRPPTILNDT